MERFTLALVFFSCACLAQGVLISNRVVGGMEATPGAYPWQVYVEGVKNGVWMTGCGATLISDRHVLTAAQCLGDGIQIARVYLGAHNISAFEEENRVVMETGNFVLHPEFSTSYYENDLAVITLPRAVTINSYIDIANLPQGADIDSDFIGTNGVFAAWGSTSGAINTMSDTLHYSYNSVIQQTDCVGHYGDAWMSTNKLCVETYSLIGPCYGDAGSALIRESDKTVLGAFSFLDIQTCASGFAVGFSRIGPYVDWINQIMSQKLE